MDSRTIAGVGARPAAQIGGLRMRVAVLAVGALVASACGSKTGPLVPDTERGDATVEDGEFQRFEACVAGRFDMVRRSAEILFVIDRSGSMFEPLEIGGIRRRWDALGDALRTTLPRFERAVNLGVMFYPRVRSDGIAGNLQFCDLTPGMNVDVAPGPMNANAVYDAFRAHYPEGATPTAAAIRRATTYLASREARGRARYIVLATDGAPNCNESIPLNECICLQGMGGCNAGPNARRQCLDDRASIAAIGDARNLGIVTYVIGLDGSIDAQFITVLDQMAIAGGRPLPTPPRYISIQSEVALSQSFAGIQRTVVQCSYVTPSRPDDPDEITVFLNGAPVPRDTTRANGWDWTDRDYGEITLFGATCDTAIATNGALAARVGCNGG